MTESQKFKKVRKKKPKKNEPSPAAEGMGSEKKKKLKELDNFIEGVLQEAGEEFLDEFKQVEGE
jgi:hypothetical protein